jgi:AcrR family transcriptional regulator
MRIAMSRTSLRVIDRREQILSAALSLFAEYGVQHVSTRQIARAVGISQPSLYAHFATREEIAVELCQRAFARLRQRMITALENDGPPDARLLRAGGEYVAFGLEEPAAYRVAFMLERVADPNAQGSRVLAAGLAAFQVMLEFFREVRAVDDEATDIAAQSCWASMHGLVSLLLTRPDFPWADRDRLVRHHLETATAAALREQLSC